MWPLEITIAPGESYGTVSVENLPRGTYVLTEQANEVYTIRSLEIGPDTNCYAELQNVAAVFHMGNDPDDKNVIGKLPGDYADKAAPDFSHAAPGAAQLMECYLVEFLFSLIRSDENSVLAMSQTPDTRRLAESSLSDSVESYMEQHVAEPPSLDVLCRHFSVSRTYLCRIFREATGTSPVDYWTNLKIKRAKALIRQGGYNITQISEELGYSSIHHFTRMFKRVTGMAPTAYRDSVGT